MTTRRAPSRMIPRAFPGIKPNEIEEMIANSQVRSYAPGTILCRENAVEDCFYMILEGEVEVSKVINNSEVRLLKTLGPGDFFGEMAVFELEKRSATVRSAGESRVLKVDKKTLLRRIGEDPLLAVNLLQTMSHRIRDLNAEIALHRETHL